MYVDVSDEYSAKKYLNHNLKRAADAELRINDQDVYWTDYLRLRYPDDYPKDFLKLANKAEIHIESLDKQECELWKFIYDYRARNQSNSNFID